MKFVFALISLCLTPVHPNELSSYVDGEIVDGQSFRPAIRQTSTSRTLNRVGHNGRGSQHGSSSAAAYASTANNNYYGTNDPYVTSQPVTATAVARATAISPGTVVNPHQRYPVGVNSHQRYPAGVNYPMHQVQGGMCCHKCPPQSLVCRQSCMPCHGGHTQYPHHRPHHSHRPLSHNPLCCSDCFNGDLNCLATCQAQNCHASTTCLNAGEGAYASYCQERCGSLGGLSAMPHFLPDAACRGACAGQVQDRCRIDNCQSFGCYAPNCGYEASSRCL